MKKFVLLFFTIVSALNICSEDVITITPQKIEPGTKGWQDEKTLSVNLINKSKNVNIIKMDICLPLGITFDTSYDEGDDKFACECNEDNVRFKYKSGPKTNKTGHTATYSVKGEVDGMNLYTVLISQGTNLTPIQGTSGEIMKIYYNVSNDIEEGVYPIYIKNIELTDAVASTKYTISSVTSYVTVGEPAIEISAEGAVSSTVVESLPQGATVDLTKVTEINGESQNEVEVVYTRPAASTGTEPIKWGTICMPVALESNASIQYYTVKEIGAEEITIKAIQNVEAGQPAIYNNKAEGGLSISATGKLKAVTATPAELIGVMQETTVTDPNTFYLKDNQFKSINNNFKIGAFKAYMKTTVPGDNARNIVIGEDATAIDALNEFMNGNHEAIYDVNGMRISNLKKGINIIKMNNGTSKKVIVE